MPDSRLERRCRELHDRERDYRKYAKSSNWILNFLGFTLIVGYFLLVLFLYIRNMEYFVYLTVALILWALIAFGLSSYLNKKAIIHDLEIDEWVLFYTCSILEELNRYFKSSPELKKELSKRIVTTGYKLLEEIQEGWSFSKFKLAKTFFGDSIANFIEVFDEIVIPFLEQGSDEGLKKIQDIFWRFAQYQLAFKPSPQDLERLTTSFKDFPTYPREKIRFARLRKFFSKHRTSKHIVFSGIIILFSIVFHGICVLFSVASKDAILVATVTLVLGLLTIYCYIQTREKTP